MFLMLKVLPQRERFILRKLLLCGRALHQTARVRGGERKGGMADDGAGGEGRCHVEEVEVVAEGRWLALHRHHWRDHTGRRRAWEVASCPSKAGQVEGGKEGEGGRRCVAVVATLSRPHPHPPALVLVKQFRPTLNAYTIELPAGLVEDGESVEEAAMRELKEETGLEGCASITSPATALDPGTADGRVWLVSAKVECGSGGGGEGGVPKVCGVEGERTEVLLLPLPSLHTALGELSATGCVVDSRVQALSLGMSVSTSMPSSS